jgi:hypothetical protein
MNNNTDSKRGDTYHLIKFICNEHRDKKSNGMSTNDITPGGFEGNVGNHI